ncbi:MAG: tyrosine-type recombinase/integrase, partial [Syntrophobacteraceae bacterium]
MGPSLSGGSTREYQKRRLRNSTGRACKANLRNNARTVYLDAELKEIFRAQWEARKAGGVLRSYVFLNETGTDKIRDFRGSWDAACIEAKISRRLFHDLRRTSIRNMVRAGIPERVAMMISGHKTRSIFDRYNIVSESDLELAASRQEAYLNSVTGTKTGTVTEMKKRAQPA